MGGRPAKSANVTAKNLSNSDRTERVHVEEELRGKRDCLEPPDWLTARQKELFGFIVNELKEADILGNLDIFVLTQFVIAMDRIMTIENKINKSPSLLHDKDLMSAKDKYSKDLYRCISELSLSPQARAKIGTLNLAKRKKEADPVLQILNGGKKISSA